MTLLTWHQSSFDDYDTFPEKEFLHRMILWGAIEQSIRDSKFNIPTFAAFIFVDGC